MRPTMRIQELIIIPAAAIAIVGFAGQSRSAGAQNQNQVRDRLIEKAKPIVDAVYRFRNDRGLWPQKLSDLTPDYIAKLADSKWDYRWSPEHECTLRRPLASRGRSRFAVRTYVIYVLGGEDAGWYSGSESNFLPLNTSQPIPPRPNRSDEEWARRAAAEFDRRIARSPKDFAQYQAKVSYLYRKGHAELAGEACLAWARAMPERLEVRRALIAVERKRRAGLDQWEHDKRWQERDYKSFGHWRIINNPFTSSTHWDWLPHALRLPFATDETEWLIAEYTAYFLAARFVNDGKYHRAIDVCDIWEKAAKKRSGRGDLSYLAIRAGAYLANGEVEKARRDVKELESVMGKGWVWADNLKPLTKAVAAADRKYRYKIQDEPRRHQDWLITP